MSVFVGWALLASIVLGIITYIFEAGEPNDFSNGLFTLVGLGLYVFGIWAAILLIRK